MSEFRLPACVHVATGRSLAGAALLCGTLLSLPAAAQSTPPAPSVPVQATTAARQDVPVVLRNIGAVQAYQSVLVRARVDGTLEKILFREGQEVKIGDPVALIDPRPYAAALAQAQSKRAADEAQMANAQHDLGRYANLARNDFASRQQLDTQTATVAQFQANIAGDDAAIATARLSVEFCNIVSPIDGRTGLRMVDAGNLVHATDTQGIVSITQIHPIALLFTLPQENLPQVQAAMARGSVPVLAFTQDDKTQLSAGHLLTIDNTIDQTTGTMRLKAEFANADDRLWPGQFVNVHVQVDTLKGVVTVPSITVQRGPEGLYAYLVKPDGTVGMQPVEILQDDGHTAVIAKGLDEGAQVVTNGQSRLQNGSKVAVNQKTGS
jgi:membrane fusion protein, multidrug efflux system